VPSALTRFFEPKPSALTRFFAPKPSALTDLLQTSLAQSAAFGLGRAPTADELKRLDTDVMPDGRGLPAGSGTAAEGRAIYMQKCASCHGASGKEGPNDVLAGGQGSLATARPMKTVGSFWPFATTLWDYVNRAMPYDRPGTLTASEVYAVTAYVLHLNGIVGERDAMTAATLPKVQMPNRNGFVPDARQSEIR
jgi:cytochrome c